MKKSLLLKRDEKSPEEIGINSLAGICALAGDLHSAAKIASREGDVLHVSEVQQGLIILSGIQRKNAELKAIFEDNSVSDLIKSIFCLATFRYGQLSVLIPFVKSRPDILKIFLDEDFDSSEDHEITELAIAVGDEPFARRCLKIIMRDVYIELSLVKKMLASFPSLLLTGANKKMLLRTAKAGFLSKEEVAASELLIGRTLTGIEQKRYAHNRFRELLDSSSKDEAVQYVWNELGRKLSKHERRLLRKDALSTLEARTKK